MPRSLLLTLFTLFCCSLNAQITTSDGTVLYGNEWVDPEVTYLKVPVVEAGVYRLSPEVLRAAGFTGSLEGGGGLRLEHQGRVVPVHVDERGLFFYGEGNDGALDAHLFEEPGRMQLNDAYSMSSDTAVYFLAVGKDGRTYTPSTATGGEPLREIVRTSLRRWGGAYSKSFFRSSGISIYYSRYDVAEGFGLLGGNDLLSSNGTTEIDATIPTPAATRGQATLDLRFGLGFDRHEQSISVNGTELTNLTEGPWKVKQYSLPFESQGEEATVSLRGSGSDRDKANLAWMRVTYPARPTAGGLTTFLAPASSQNQTLTLTDLPAGTGSIQLLDHRNGRLINGGVEGASAVFSLPASTDTVVYHVLTTAGALTPTGLTSVTLAPQLPPGGGADYLIVTSERLNGEEVRALADYRESVAGGSHRVHIVNVEDLYDQFSYGVRRHPLAIRNYVAAAVRAQPELRYLFLIGKGREMSDLRSPQDLANGRRTFFVPSFGFPASDNLLTAPIDGVVPALATGRLAAINRGEVGLYLTKLRDVEAQIDRGEQTLADRDWMKQILHLGGGVTPGEQSSIRSRLGNIETTIESSDMGANVNSFFKTSSDPIEDSRQDAIFERINAGTSIITFFGHSSSQGFDFSIDNPDNYRNKDRYPFMLSLGCYSGDSFTAARSISERFIFLRNRGAVAFAASKGLGFITALGRWGNNLYDLLGNEYYGRGIGEAMRANVEAFSGASIFSEALLAEQFSLSGDPAFRLHPRPGADLVVDPAQVQFEPAVVPASLGTYKAFVRVANLGRASTQDSVTLRFRQQLPDGSIVALKDVRTPTVNYEEQIEVELPNQGFAAVGINRILVTIDAEDELAEAPLPSAESNNDLFVGGRIGVPLTFIANTAQTAYPPRYALIGGPVELVASTTNPLIGERRYFLEVATDRAFGEVVHSSDFTAGGGIIRQSPTIDYRDSTTYYWRISPDSSTTEGAGFIWSESSFTWLASRGEGPAAWAVNHPGQTTDGTFENIVDDGVTEAWRFTKTSTDLRVANGRYVGRQFPRVEFNGQRFNSRFEWLYRGGVNVWVIDTINNRDWLPNPGGLYGTPDRPSTLWQFQTSNPEKRRQMLEFLEEGIPDGKYVLVYSADRGDLYYNDGWLQDSLNFGKSLFDVLEAEGAEQVRGIPDRGNVPYVFAYQKGFGPLAEGLGESRNDRITVELAITTNWDSGSWTSPRVGPAQSWRGLELAVSPLNLSAADSVRVRLIGTTPEGVDAQLRDEILSVPEDRTIEIDLSDIAASSYPQLAVEAFLFDRASRTSATVKYAYFDYTGSGDVAVSPAVAFTVPDTLDTGSELNLDVGYENIGDQAMDSLLVELRLQTDANSVSTYRKRQAPLPAGGSDRVTFTLPTEELLGRVQLQLLLNPERDQPEDILFNNLLTRELNIGRDDIDPLIQVFFDGQRIQNGELISAEPEILVQIRDENENLLLNDTADYQLDLIYPDGRRQRLWFEDERVSFIPAASTDNFAEIYFQPTLEQDGTYTLTVRGRDRSGNNSGKLDFRKDFEVINQQLVSNVLAYPNPFTTQTQFVYTLTGSRPPTMFRIQIMTVSGRVVRDVDLSLLEDLSIGTHRTEFVWDGTDEYGDQLANGVYLYRVITSDDAGKSLERYDTGTDQYFEKGFGKVVLLR